MTKTKRCFIISLAIIMMFATTFSATAMAAEAPAGEGAAQVTASGDIDDTFTIGATHRGADRTYNADRLYVRAIISGTDGNAVDSNVSITLNDYNGNSILWNVPADGNLYGKTFHIVPGRTYYFYYTRTGAANSLKLRIIIHPYYA